MLVGIVTISLLMFGCVLMLGIWVRGPVLELPPHITIGDIRVGVSQSSAPGWKEWNPRRLPLRQHLISIADALVNRLKGKGQSLKIPSPPDLVYLRSNLQRLADETGDSYLLAQELFPRSNKTNSHEVLYRYGGKTNRVDTRTWTKLNLNGLLENGVVVARCTQTGSHPLEFTVSVSTNFFAFIRDEPAKVKVVPVERLRDYAAAGLIDPGLL